MVIFLLAFLAAFLVVYLAIEGRKKAAFRAAMLAKRAEIPPSDDLEIIDESR